MADHLFSANSSWGDLHFSAKRLGFRLALATVPPSSSTPTSSRSRMRILPLQMVVWHWRPVMPKSMWPSMFSPEKGVKGL